MYNYVCTIIVPIRDVLPRNRLPMLKAIKSRSRDLLMVTVDVIAGILVAGEGPIDEPNSLLDLSHLNDEEVSIIKLVLEKDEKLIEEERIRLR